MLAMLKITPNSSALFQRGNVHGYLDVSNPVCDITHIAFQVVVLLITAEVQEAFVDAVCLHLVTCLTQYADYSL